MTVPRCPRKVVTNRENVPYYEILVLYIPLKYETLLFYNYLKTRLNIMYK